MKIDLSSLMAKWMWKNLGLGFKGGEFLEFANIPNEKKVKLVFFKFQRGASGWWEQLVTNWRYYGKTPHLEGLSWKATDFFKPNFNQ